ncbi:hypothetical protein HB364_23010 [Pseudoflavitalea sp. X16]|uniref:hypothetical protein n=1 Tax=Paraflavitalea devenefica TaxID=2716334 RepID=UPI0014203684|nr:hypothetical protein [Paraflavitalea devenefica]NII27973.1 hypothetical protein [Paraflavitalea devenefica]
MKIPTTYLTLFTALLFSLTTIAQQKVRAPNRKAQSASHHKGDTIYFALPFRYSYNDSIPGIGRPLLPDIGYVLVRSGNKVVSWKYISYCNGDCTNFLSATSDWIYLDNDTLFSWLSKNLERIRQEELHPFIYQTKEHNLVYYEPLQSSHQEAVTFFISIGGSGKEIRKNINLRHVEQHTGQGYMKNINYAYNSNTRLYRLYLMLEQRFKAWDMKYTFSRVK